MKKTLLILFILVSLVASAQTPPISGSSGTDKGAWLTKGVPLSDSGFWNRYSFPDTTAANKGLLKNCPGIEIRVGDTLKYLRNQATTAWILVSGKGGSGGSVTASNGLTSVNGDIQLFGTTTQNDTIKIGTRKFVISNGSTGSTFAGLTMDFTNPGGGNGAIMLLDSRSLAGTGIGYLGMDPGNVKFYVENFNTPTVSANVGIAYASTAAGFTAKLTNANITSQWFLGAGTNPFADSSLMIRVVSGNGIQFCADNGSGGGYFWFKNSAVNLSGVYGGFAAGGNFAVGTMTAPYKFNVNGDGNITSSLWFNPQTGRVVGTTNTPTLVNPGTLFVVATDSSEYVVLGSASNNGSWLKTVGNNISDVIRGGIDAEIHYGQNTDAPFRIHFATYSGSQENRYWFQRNKFIAEVSDSISFQAPAYKLAGMPTGTKAFVLMQDANGYTYKADTTGLFGGGGSTLTLQQVFATESDAAQMTADLNEVKITLGGSVGVAKSFYLGASDLSDDVRFFISNNGTGKGTFELAANDSVNNISYTISNSNSNKNIALQANATGIHLTTLNIYPDSMTLDQTSGAYRFQAVPYGSIDTTTYKPASLDVNGRFRRMNSWAQVVGPLTWQRTLTAGSTLTGDNTIAGGGFNFTFNNASSLSLNSTVESIFRHSGGTAAYTRMYQSFNGADKPYTDIEAVNAAATIISQIHVGVDSIKITPPSGLVNILTLRSGYIDTSIYKPLARKSTTGDIVQMNSWAQVSGGGGGTNIYNSDGTLSGNRSLSGNDLYSLEFDHLSSFRVHTVSGPELSLSDSIRIPILGQSNDTTGRKILTRNSATGALTWSNWIGGGGGSGTVTNVATGLGLSGGPITSTGTIIADTSYLVNKSTAQVIAAIKNFTGVQNFTNGFTTAASAATSGTFMRGNGTAYVASTLTIPNTSTANRVVYSTATSTYGESANFTFDGSNAVLSGGVTAASFQTLATAANGNFQTGSGTGAASSTSTPLQLPGPGANNAYRVQINGNVNGTPAANSDYGQFTVGGGLWIEASGGTHPHGYGMYIASSTVTNAGGATDTLVGLEIAGPPTGVTAATGSWNTIHNRGDVLIKYGSLNLGFTGGATGLLKLFGVTSGIVSIQSAAAAGTYTLTLPTTDGNANEYLQTDGNGVLTWAAGASGVSGVGTINSVGKSANGAVVSGSNIILQTVDASFPGLMTSAQKARLDSNYYIITPVTGVQVAKQVSVDTLRIKSLVAGNSMTITNNGDSTITIGTTFNPTVQTLTDASTITWDVTSGGNSAVTLGATGRTLSITNPVAGNTYTIRVIQDGTGSRTITTWPTNTKWPANGTAPTLTTTASRYDIITFYYDGTNYYGNYNLNYN
jgi:hypothetical protein